MKVKKLLHKQDSEKISDMKVKKLLYKQASEKISDMTFKKHCYISLKLLHKEESGKIFYKVVALARNCCNSKPHKKFDYSTPTTLRPFSPRRNFPRGATFSFV